MTAGFSNVKLIAPSTGSTANMAVVGPQTLTAGAALAAGANQCLIIVGTQISISAGAAGGSSCTGIGSGGGGSSGMLVQ
jgi:hypothetical protein